jgi:hemerythrin-like domain-containing protein
MTETARKALDAIELLMQDHREVESLFTEFEYLQQNGENTADVIAIACAELRMHDALENEIFYPALSSAAGDDEVEALLDDAEEAHDNVLDLIDDLDGMDSDGAARDAHFKLIVAQVAQHIAQEESELFPRATRLSSLDLDSVTAAMKSRREELMAGAELAETTAESA